MHHYDLCDYRCTCGKLLCKGAIVQGIVEVKCKHCHEVMRFSGATRTPYAV